MRKQILKNTLIFFLIFVILVLFSSCIYYYVSESIVMKQGAQSISDVNKSVSTEIDIAITNDYKKFTSFIDNHEKLGVQELNKLLPELQKSGFNIYMIGEQEKNLYTFGGVTYTGTNSDISGYYDNDLSIFNFYNDMQFKSTEDKNLPDKSFFCLSYKGFVAISYVDVYIAETLESLTNYESDFFIVSQDGTIFFQTKQFKNNQMFDYLRNFNSEKTVEKVKQMFASDKSVCVGDVLIDDEYYFLASTNVSFNLSSINLKYLQAFQKSNVRNILKSILIPILAQLIIYSIVLFCGMLFLYLSVLKQNNEIKRAKIIHYNERVLTLKINNKGLIQSFSSGIKRKYHLEKGMSLNDLKSLEDYQDNVAQVKAQYPITLVVKNKITNSLSYLYFIPTLDYQNRLLIGSDITPRADNYFELEKKALYNATTNLPNWEKLRSDLKSILSYMREQEKSSKNFDKMSLILFEIDNFKRFNELFSHKMGQEVLIKTKDIFQEKTMSFKSTLYNLDVDLFAILIYNVTDYSEIIRFVEEMIDYTARPLEIDGNTLIINYYYGIFNFEKETIKNFDSDEIINNTLRTLTKIKSFSNKKYEVFNLNISRFLSKEQVIENDIRSGIENDEFVMFLQPQYDNSLMKIDGFEALIRWKNPKYSLQSPATFIEIAERNNMIIQIGKIVFEQTFKIAKQLEKYQVSISVNVSPVQLMQAGFVNEIFDYLETYEINPKYICIEITETFLMENFDVMVEKLKLLKKRGFTIHLDDFGTGYSSMLYLKELPIDAIKIDKGFITYLSTDKFSRVVVQKIITLGKNLDLEIIAEGVEDIYQNQFLAKNGCNIIQGYIISKAVPLSDAIDMLERYNIKKEIPEKMIKAKQK